MKIGIVTSGRADWSAIAQALAAGVQQCGDQVVVAPYGVAMPRDIGAVATWGWRRGKRIFERGKVPVLVMERGYIGDRFKWTSLGWNGLNGHAKFAMPSLSDGFERFAKRFGMAPWQVRPNGYALIMGQVPGDAACANVNLPAFYDEATVTMRKRGFDVRFRPHPLARGI